MAKREKRVGADEHARVCRERDRLYLILREQAAGRCAAVTVWHFEGTRFTWKLYHPLGAEAGIVLQTEGTKTSTFHHVYSLDELVILQSGHFGDAQQASCKSLGDLLRARDRAFEQDKQAHKQVRAAGV